LYNIFIVFGAPLILQTDNGTEFTSSIIAELMSLWLLTKIIRGRPRHPQSQGAVERANAILKKKLAKWMEFNGSKRWAKGLPLVTHAMNVSVCRVTNCTPYELVFNQKPRSHHTLLDDFDDNEIIAEENLNIEFGESSYSMLQHKVDEENHEQSDKRKIMNRTMKRETMNRAMKMKTMNRTMRRKTMNRAMKRYVSMENYIIIKYKQFCTIYL